MRFSKTIFIPVCALVSALAVGCNRETTKDDETAVKGPEAPVGETPAGQPGQEAAAQLSEEGREFVTKATQHGLFEMEVGRMAQTQAQLEPVKQLASKLVEDHTKTNQELQKLAQTKNVTVPTALNDDGRDTKEDLAEKTGKDFDDEYIEAVIDRHEKSINEFEEMSRQTKDPELQRWATNQLPAMRNHLAEAKRIKEQTVDPNTGLFN